PKEEFERASARAPDRLVRREKRAPGYWSRSRGGSHLQRGLDELDYPALLPRQLTNYTVNGALQHLLSRQIQDRQIRIENRHSLFGSKRDHRQVAGDGKASSSRTQKQGVKELDVVQDDCGRFR